MNNSNGHYKILVADDEPDLESLVLQKFRAKISSGEYRFFFAKDGAEALSLLNTDSTIDLILTDINMPVMDGLTLLANVRELNNRCMKSVIISAYGDMENIRSAMNNGAFDFLTKPINLKDLEITVSKSLRENAEHKLALLNNNKLIALKQELDIARVIQTSILPRVFPVNSRFIISAEMQPAREVGGDFYDIFMLNENKLAVIIGDVSGKGIASALLMAVCKTLVKHSASAAAPLSQVLFKVNNILADESPENMFATLFFGVLDTSSGTFEYSNAGHLSPFIITSESTSKPLEAIGGMVLGIFKDQNYSSKIIKLQPGDSLFFYTDGITEAFNTAGEEFGEQRLCLLLSRSYNLNPEDLIRSAVSEVAVFAGDIEQSDDITCLALKYN